jgi:hypothetical protein
VRYKFLYYVVFISFLVLKIVESVKIPASKMAAIKQSPVPPPPPLSFCEGPRILQNLRDVVFQIVELPLYILSFLRLDTVPAYVDWRACTATLLSRVRCFKEI